MVKFKKCPKCGYYPQPGDRYVFERCNSCGLNYSNYYKRRSGINTFIFWHVVLLLSSIFFVEINGGWKELIGAIKSKHTDFSQTKGMITYRVVTVIDRRINKIDHLMKVFGMSFRNSLNVGEVKLVSIMHRGHKSPDYPILWLRQKNGKKYKVGEFPSHGDAIIVRDILDFCKIRFGGYEG